MGTIAKPPEDFNKPVIVLTDLPERELVPGQEELVEELKERIRKDNASGAANHRYWAMKCSDFYGQPAPHDYGIKLQYRYAEPTGVIITPKWLNDKFDGQMGFPATFVRYRDDIPGVYNWDISISQPIAVYAEFMLSELWQRYHEPPHLYTT